MNLPVKMNEAKDKYSTFFIELYTLELRGGITYIAACDENIYYKRRLYTAVPFSRGDIKSSMDEPTQELEIQIGDVNDDHLAFLMNGFDFRGCKATLSRILYPDSVTTDTDLEQFLFSGYIDSPSFENGVFACTIKNVFPSMKAPQRMFDLPCNSYFGDSICGLDLNTTNDIVEVNGGNTIVLQNSYEADFWKNGTARINGESRNIVSSNGNQIKIHINFLQQSITGATITLERGCDKTQEDCRRHNNLKKYTGFPAIPFESVYR